MFALTDATGCYSAIEKIFDPSIRHRPVVVLTNNDGNICALCPIARDLGIPKFEPYFKVKHLLAKHNVVVRSSNYELYADISQKMMNVIARYAQNTYVYSIDEAFSDFNNYDNVIKDWYGYGHIMRRAVWKETRMPVGVGFGPTLTLAKAANHGSKKLPDSDGVCVINDEYSRKHILSQMKLDHVWGIGRKLSQHLSLMGLKTAWDLSCQNPKAMRKQFSVLVERTINELNGVPCLAWDDVKTQKKEIFSTRSMGKRITCRHQLRQALTSHVATVARKAFEQRTLIKKIAIFASSSPHDEIFYKKSVVAAYPAGTNNLATLSESIELAMKELYREGVNYYRAGVGAIELVDATIIQQDMFSPVDTPVITECYHDINKRFGRGTLMIGSEAGTKTWSMRREFLSPRSTTRWSDIPKINC
tara:strand:- start:87 stop:1340 length:1254 start_codon:yes stop_codon:yes gene_type:complete